MAIKDKESGHERELTRYEKDRMIEKDEARRRRLTKLRIRENKERPEDIRKARKEGANDEEIEAVLADLFEQWQA